MSETNDILGLPIIAGDRVAFPHSDCKTLVVGTVIGITPKRCKIQCEVGHRRKPVHTYDPKETPEITYRNHSNCIVISTRLVENAAASELAVKLQKENDRLMESLHVIKKIKLAHAFGDLNLTDYASGVIDTESRKHGIY